MRSEYPQNIMLSKTFLIDDMKRELEDIENMTSNLEKELFELSSLENNLKENENLQSLFDDKRNLCLQKFQNLGDKQRLFKEKIHLIQLL